MGQEYVEHFEHIIENIPVGIMMLDAHTLRICYANQYIRSQLMLLYKQQDIIGCPLADLLPAESEYAILPTLQQVAVTGERQQFDELPFEGLLESRGQTYWRISIERRTHSSPYPQEECGATTLLLITIEDVTQSVRSRLHLHAIHTISATIPGPSSLQVMLNSILQVLQEIFGSKRCAIYLFDHVLPTAEISSPKERQQDSEHQRYEQSVRFAGIVAQKGLFGDSSAWHIVVNEHVLLSDVMKKRSTCIITDTSQRPDLRFPDLDYQSTPCRPRSVLSVPIFAPNPIRRSSEANEKAELNDIVLGTIEVYHRGARAFPAEEVELLEQFAHQVGLAIQIESEIIARTTELKQRHQALQRLQQEQANTNAHLALLLEGLPVSVILVSAKNNRITVINRQALQLFQRLGVPLASSAEQGHTNQYAIGMNCKQLIQAIRMYGPTGAPILYKDHPLSAALKYGQSKEMELHIRMDNGQFVYLFVNASPLYTDDGTISSAILVYQDITRIKLLEHAREDFFTSMAHELKTPLANIRAHLSVLLAQDLQWSRNEQRDFLQTADQQVDRLVGMVNHFLDASRIEAGALRLDLEPIIVSELFEDLQDRLEALIASAQCHLDVSIPEQLPTIQGDYELIISVLTNLLSNAFRYTPENEAVHLCAVPILDGSKRQRGVKFSVIDHGPGISKEQQAALFTRFSTFAQLTRPSIDSPGQPELTRHQKNTRWSPGTGLGLYISRGILEAHGSQLEVISSPRKGAQFTFTLPAYKKIRKQRNTSSSSLVHISKWSN